MTQQPQGPYDKSEFENYKLWLDRIRAEHGTHGVAEATFRLYTDNRRLRLEVRRLQSAEPSLMVKPANAVQRPGSPSRAVQLAQGEQTRNAIYSFLQSYFQKHERSPSLREIAAGVGVTTVVITRHLTRLEQEGKISREPGVERGITLV